MKKIANRIMKIAKEISSVGKGPRFQAGDIVKMQSRKRTTFRVIRVEYHYAVYDEDKEFIASFTQEQLQRKQNGQAVTFNPNNEYGGIGDIIDVTRGKMMGLFKIGYIQEYYTLKNLRTGKVFSSIEPANLMRVDDAEIDENGRDAYTAAVETYPKGTKIVVAAYRYSSERAGVVLDIGNTGRIKVQTYMWGEFSGQERAKADFSRKDEVMVFTPGLYHSEWGWHNRKHSQYIRKVYDGGYLSLYVD